MIQIDRRSIDDVFREAVEHWPNAAFLAAPSKDGEPAHDLTYAKVEDNVASVAKALKDAGYGAQTRVALLLGSCPQHYAVKLAVNRIGASIVPINPDYRPAELAYVLEDSGAELAIADEAHTQLMQNALAELATPPSFVAFETMLSHLPAANTPREAAVPGPETEASLLYTSGTTGRPKGCILSHEYELMCGDSYRNAREPIALRINGDRIFNPLPAFHINAGIVTFFGALLTGNCLIQPSRFSASSWWTDIAETRATVFHYLGVVISVLLADRIAGPEKLANLRVGFGAGVEPALHVEFERRFGIPLIECWGMTEMCRVLVVDQEPRMIDTRAMGRSREDLEVMVVDANDREVPRGHPGEMIVRHSAETPRKGAFSGYLNKADATAEAWRGGWFHTGDTVTMDESGMVFFLDRAKNIIRRAGENIAAAEVENCLFEDARVTAVACLAVPDTIREEEVMACIVLSPGTPETEDTARALFDHAFARIAYFKPPGYILFVEELPVTGTQKVVKHKIFADGENPLSRAGVFDLRTLKKRR